MAYGVIPVFFCPYNIRSRHSCPVLIVVVDRLCKTRHAIYIFIYYLIVLPTLIIRL